MREAITQRIEDLDRTMQRIMKIKSANAITSGNLMISGKTPQGSPVHEIFNWPEGTRSAPKTRLYIFLSEWLSELIMQKQRLSETLAAGQVKFTDKSVLLQCHFCAKPTVHRNYFTIATVTGLVNIPTASGSCICIICDNLKFQQL